MPETVARQRMFTLEENHLKRLESWSKTHDSLCRYADAKNLGAIGGRFIFSFTPSSIGTFINARCMCGESIDLTEEENW
jgi:hypothetical protein